MELNTYEREIYDAIVSLSRDERSRLWHDYCLAIGEFDDLVSVEEVAQFCFLANESFGIEAVDDILYDIEREAM